ncbi:GNAT family N-acetyltransferase [uncultured Marixanthomonas sp.]|uniref:GNAT family N-acetyltransferase n=1 Tax=uncultured Marixanthomonas sp. TaxID=757245 RepID=UPI0030DBF2E0|tara:strand:+ start:6212 stop:6487 length:276 start_codon:yes stop_codon:yes gene_type:complete
MGFTILDNKEKKRFEATVQKQTVIVDYKIERNTIYLTRVKVPTELEGQGIGSTMVEQVLQKIEAMGFKLVPVCPFVKYYIDKNPKWNKLLD